MAAKRASKRATSAKKKTSPRKGSPKQGRATKGGTKKKRRVTRRKAAPGARPGAAELEQALQDTFEAPPVARRPRKP
jgi:hypothetical protein